MSNRRIDVSVVRQAISKLVGLLTDKNITVTQRGMQAYVEYTPAGKIKSMNIPYLPDNASEEFIAAVQGFVDHEVGHVLHTDPMVLKKANKMGSVVAGMHNIIEDTYIERMMTKSFQGSKNTLNAVRRFHIEKMSAGKIDEALAAGDKDTAIAYLIVLVFRAWAGQTPAKEYVSSTPELAELTASIENKVGTDLLAQLGGISSSADALDMTIKVLDRMKSKEETPPPSKGKSKPTKAEDRSEPEPDQPPAEEKEEDGEGDTGNDETSSGGEEKNDEGESKEGSGSSEEPEEGDTDESDSGSGGEVSETIEEQEEDSKSRGKADGDSDNVEEKDEDVGIGREGSEAPEEGSEGEERADADEGDGDEGKESSDRPAPTATAAQSTGGDDEEESGELPEGKDVDLEKIFDKFVDFDESVSAALSTEACNIAAKDICPVFSRDFDTIDYLPYRASETRTNEVMEKVQHMIAPMAKSLQRALAAKDKVTWNPGQRRGRINAGSLHRVAVGDDRVFRTRYETKAKNTAVTLLVDCSGSMSIADRITSAFQSAIALSSTLDRLKIEHEVIGFTTTKDRMTEMKRALRKDGSDICYPRGQPLYMPIFKGFGERLGSEQLQRMAYMTTYSAHGILRENADGESLRIAADRLRQQRAERKLMIVLSDGTPMCPPMSGAGEDAAYNGLAKLRAAAGMTMPLDYDLIQAVKEVSSSGIEVVGVGIQHPAVKKFYPNSINLTSVSKLPEVVMGELTKMLLS